MEEEARGVGAIGREEDRRGKCGWEEKGSEEVKGKEEVCEAREAEVIGRKWNMEVKECGRKKKETEEKEIIVFLREDNHGLLDLAEG